MLGPLPGDSPESLTPLYHSLLSSFPSPPHPVSRASLFRLLYDSLSLSTWKITGFSTWSLCINPSSGNLHPTEAHLLSPPLPDGDSPFSSSSFLTHYSPKDHSLELHAHLDLSSLFPDHGGSVLLLALSSIYWREARKYGERALCYCNHDVDHAFAAASLGWDARLLDGLGHNDLDLLLSLHRANPLPRLPSAGTPASSMALATTTSTSSSASTAPTLCRLPIPAPPPPRLRPLPLDRVLASELRPPPLPLRHRALMAVPDRAGGLNFLSSIWHGLMGHADTVRYYI